MSGHHQLDAPSFPKSSQVALYLSISISVAIISTAILHISHDLDHLFRVHVAVAAVFAASGLLQNSTSASKYVYVITGSISWYGVLYSFVSSESHIEAHHYFQPEILIAFLTYAGSLLTIPEVENIRSILYNPLYNSAGLICLLAYFWIAESYFARTKNEFFIDSVMNKMPPRLVDFTLFLDHRISYSVVLISSHYCNVLFLWMILRNSELSDDSEEKYKIDHDTIEEELRYAVRQKIDNKKKNDEMDINMRVSFNADSNTENSRVNHSPAPTPTPINIGSAKNIKRNYNAEIDSESSLPDDCIEISYDDAMLLSGDSSALPSFPTSNMPENSSNAFDSNCSERDNVSVMKEGKYEHGSA